MALDAVVELRVDEAALLTRIEKRVAETLAAAEPCGPMTIPRRSAHVCRRIVTSHLRCLPTTTDVET